MVLANTPKRSTPAHEKKRHGHHHKHTKHYSKTYFPYLPILLLVVVGFVTNVWLTPRHAVLGAQSDISINSLLQDTNSARSDDHVVDLNLNAQLTQAANAKAADMAAANYWSHTSPAGKTPWAFIQQSGYQYQAVGENLAYGFTNSSAALKAWLNSPEHRANLLNANYRDVGFGIAEAADYQGHGPETIIVAMYGEPVGQGAAVLGATSQTIAAPEHIARLQALNSGVSSWMVGFIAFIAGGAIAIFIVRHGVFLHRAWRRGERFVVTHPALDVVLVALGVIGFILTRTSGFIQ
ncbi:MAG TPA: CAP domain-containing protein [Candidatus Saccharimonadales bacterium]|nr:CAP domain-containing protein [Candidatus Saccharimonadales bacterium]